MENQKQNNPTNIIEETKKTGRRISTSTTFRMIIIGALTLILMIPMAFVSNLVSDRKYRKKQVISEINKSWGKSVEIYGPILKIPYKTYKKTTYFDSNNKRVETTEFDGYEYLYTFPNELNIDGNIEGQPKKIGIYKSAVYKADNHISGDFTLPDFKKYDIKQTEVEWKKAEIIFKTTNNKGIVDKMIWQWNGEKFPFALSGKNNDKYFVFKTDFLGKSPFINNEKVKFEMSYKVKGSKTFKITPIGNQTKVRLQSNWKDTKFEGYFLPDNEDKITETGFDAHWKVIDYQRAFSQYHLNQIPNFSSYAFGVNFIIPVDEYLKSDRATKYAYLVIFLTFIVFFIIQNVGKIEMHPFHYFLIGIALVVFYTLLISISEHSNFNISYLISASATIGLISLYAKSILKSKRFIGYIFTSLTMLYGYIYIIIQLDNYALLAGSIGLFIILAMIMYFSRKIKW
jgi:inner membrane protein